MAPPRSRPLLVLLSSGLLLAALVAALATRTPGRAPGTPTAYARSIDAAPGTHLRSQRVGQAGISWHGGPITTSTGETVTVYVSDSVPPETATPEGWAEFLAGLTHGPELSQLTARIGTFEEVQSLCGSQALGCYSANQLVAPAQPTIDGTTPEDVVRHEYGHHVAFHRLNPPWAAIDWGPKQWASSASVCSRVSRQEAYPGDEGSNYDVNPGEAWAEVYRLMDERTAGITTATWPIIAPSFFPGEPALQAAQSDVLTPWTSTTTRLVSRTFTKRTKVWWIPLRTPFDGDLRLSATLPRGGNQQVALVAANRRTIIGRAEWVGQRVKRFSGTVCGQRSLFVRVTGGAPGRVRVSTTTP